MDALQGASGPVLCGGTKITLGVWRMERRMTALMRNMRNDREGYGITMERRHIEGVGIRCLP